MSASAWDNTLLSLMVISSLFFLPRIHEGGPVLSLILYLKEIKIFPKKFILSKVTLTFVHFLVIQSSKKIGLWGTLSRLNMCSIGMFHEDAVKEWKYKCCSPQLMLFYSLGKKPARSKLELLKSIINYLVHVKILLPCLTERIPGIFWYCKQAC